MFRCSDWKTAGAPTNSVPLTYKFRYQSEQSDVQMVFQTITSRDRVVSSTGKLPVGERTDGFKLRVQILIVDAYGSATVQSLTLVVCTCCSLDKLKLEY